MKEKPRQGDSSRVEFQRVSFKKSIRTKHLPEIWYGYKDVLRRNRDLTTGLRDTLIVKRGQKQWKRTRHCPCFAQYSYTILGVLRGLVLFQSRVTFAFTHWAWRVWNRRVSTQKMPVLCSKKSAIFLPPQAILREGAVRRTIKRGRFFYRHL